MGVGAFKYVNVVVGVEKKKEVVANILLTFGSYSDILVSVVSNHLI